MKWRIVSEAGVDMGEYAGETPAEALDECARDAGYRDAADAAAASGDDGGGPRVLPADEEAEARVARDADLRRGPR